MLMRRKVTSQSINQSINQSIRFNYEVVYSFENRMNRQAGVSVQVWLPKTYVQLEIPPVVNQCHRPPAVEFWTTKARHYNKEPISYSIATRAERFRYVILSELSLMTRDPSSSFRRGIITR
jgi:hypothetical protein